MFLNTMIDMYAKYLRIYKFQEIFNNIYVADIHSWNALILGYKIHGYSKDAQIYMRNLDNIP